MDEDGDTEAPRRHMHRLHILLNPKDPDAVLVLKDDDTLALPEIGLAIPLAEFYQGLAFEAQPVEDNDNDRPPPATA